MRLRAPEERDFAQWLEWVNDPAVMEGLDRARPVTEEEHRHFVERAPIFAIETDDGNYAGNVWLWDVHERHKRAEVRLFIGPPYHGRGLATAAIGAVARRAFVEMGLHKLYAFVHASNERSKRAFLSAGFAVEGTLREEAFRDGAFRDVYRLARIAER
jgi:RimJ/RimL family protein N-acetyltransferase